MIQRGIGKSTVLAGLVALAACAGTDASNIAAGSGGTPSGDGGARMSTGGGAALATSAGGSATTTGGGAALATSAGGSATTTGGGAAIPPSAGAGGIGTGGDTGLPPSEGGNTVASGGEAGASSSGGTQLLGPPLAFGPTAWGFGLNAVVASGDPLTLRARVRAEGTATWGDVALPEVRAPDVAQWTFEGLDPGTQHEYEILAAGADGETLLYSGRAVTQREPGESFTFALLTDSHIGPDATYSNQGNWNTLATVGAELDAASPDFMLNLGDMLDFHQFGFNDPPPEGSYTRSAYLNYRSLLGDTLGHAAHYAVIGNWEGENGCYTADEIAWSRDERLLYLPGPNPVTYPEGGSPAEDYYAFTWGDALFIVLNVMGYTPTEHLLDYNPGVPNDWTLGEAQFGWFADTLANATSKWRFVLIHHTVGGAAPDEINAAYGRGGGQAAHVGEQALVHQLMLDYGVQVFFYGHDHVFADMVVDGIHYSMPGNAGAIWMFTAEETGYEQAWLEPGWSRVDVGPDSVDVKFVAMGGELLHEYAVE